MVIVIGFVLGFWAALYIGQIRQLWRYRTGRCHCSLCGNDYSDDYDRRKP